jgi:hypothetical protein
MKKIKVRGDTTMLSSPTTGTTILEILLVLATAIVVILLAIKFFRGNPKNITSEF